jgi:hypothetical protein
VVSENGEAFQLREPGVSYLIDFATKNDDAETEDGYFLGVKKSGIRSLWR